MQKMKTQDNERFVQNTVYLKKKHFETSDTCIIIKTKNWNMYFGFECNIAKTHVIAPNAIVSHQSVNHAIL